ncbi:MAG: ribonuclease domain-containing protein [Eubacteriales bacterium]
MNKRLRTWFLAFWAMLALALAGCGNPQALVSSSQSSYTSSQSAYTSQSEDTDDFVSESSADTETGDEETVSEDGTYTDKDSVALYLHLYRHLPSNYITKDEAYDLGWKSEGTLDEVAPGMSIGGDVFGNYEGKLPEESGRTYYECDIDYVSGSRNAERIIWSDDGLIYYTGDHYETFEQLYDGWAEE